jgi:hypothetical protein
VKGSSIFFDPFLPAQQPGGQISVTFDGVASIVKPSQFNQL